LLVSARGKSRQADRREASRGTVDSAPTRRAFLTGGALAAAPLIAAPVAQAANRAAPAGARQRYVTESGLDTNDGRSWATAFRTVGRAVASLGGAGRIDVGAGNYPPFALTGSGILVEGRGPTTQINATSSTGTIIDLREGEGDLRNLRTFGGPTYKGVHVYLHQNAGKSHVANVLAGNDDATRPENGFGGTAFLVEDCEGVMFDGCSFRSVRRGFDLANATSGHYRNIHGDRAWQSLVLRAINGQPGSGGNLFEEWKSVHSPNPGGVVVDIGGNGENTFIAMDVEEADDPPGNRVLIHSAFNEWIRFASAPGTFVEITSGHNTFHTPKFLERGLCSASNCEFWHPRMLNGGWVINGSLNLVHQDSPANRMSGPGIKRLVLL
jgi:hypothetical protein